MRERVLSEEPICRVTDCDQPATEDDHIVGWSARQAAGLTIDQWHARGNHQGLCTRHHTMKTQHEAYIARRQANRRPRRRHPSEA